MSQNKEPKFCQLGMAGLNFKHRRIDLCYRATNGSGPHTGRTEHWDTIKSALDDPILAKQRLALLNGEWPIERSEGLERTPCADCMKAEAANFPSYREKIRFSDQITDEWLRSNVDPITGVMKHPVRVEFRFSNVCNQACRHCNADYSTKWAKIVKNNWEELEEYSFHSKTFSDKQNRFEIFGSVHDDSLEYSTASKIDMESLVPYLKAVKDHKTTGVPDFMEIEITGGEPFFQRETYEFLEAVKEYAPWIVLIITTNGSIAGKFKRYNLNELLKPFGKVVLKFSLDSDRHFYDYFREGGDYQRVRDNIEQLKQDLPKASIEIVISTTNMQAARFANIYDEFKEITSPENFTMCEVQQPKIYTPYVLPNELKEIYLNNWKNYVQTLDEDEQHIANELSIFPVRCLEDRNFDAETWHEFCVYTDKLDKINGKRVFDYFPEWEEYWTTK